MQESIACGSIAYGARIPVSCAKPENGERNYKTIRDCTAAARRGRAVELARRPPRGGEADRGSRSRWGRRMSNLQRAVGAREGGGEKGQSSLACGGEAEQ